MIARSIFGGRPDGRVWLCVAVDAQLVEDMPRARIRSIRRVIDSHLQGNAHVPTAFGAGVHFHLFSIGRRWGIEMDIREPHCWVIDVKMPFTAPVTHFPRGIPDPRLPPIAAVGQCRRRRAGCLPPAAVPNLHAIHLKLEARDGIAVGIFRSLGAQFGRFAYECRPIPGRKKGGGRRRRRGRGQRDDLQGDKKAHK